MIEINHPMLPQVLLPFQSINLINHLYYIYTQVYPDIFQHISYCIFLPPFY